MTISTEILEAQLARTLDGVELSGVGVRYEGKVRDNYTTPDGRRILIATDRISAFDVVLGTIPFKGQVLNQLAQYWFQETAILAQNHVLSVPDPNVTIARECVPLRAEFVMRAYLTGVTSTSIWYAYERGAREFCGHKLADGMKKNERLPRALLTPSTKAEKGDHDVSVSRAELIASGAVTGDDFDRAAAIAETLFAFGQRRAAERGLILVDTKYEMGKNAAGDIVVIDEIHTPDSSRYWYASDYESRLAAGEEPRGLDKEYVRRWLVSEHGYRGQEARPASPGEGQRPRIVPPPPLPDAVRIEAARRYIAIYELVTGRAFVPDTSEPIARIKRNLGLA